MTVGGQSGANQSTCERKTSHSCINAACLSFQALSVTANKGLNGETIIL